MYTKEIYYNSTMLFQTSHRKFSTICLKQKEVHDDTRDSKIFSTVVSLTL